MIKERFMQLVSIYNPKKLEELTGVDRYHWESIKYERSHLKATDLEVLFDALPEISVWLVFGSVTNKSKQTDLKGNLL